MALQPAAGARDLNPREVDSNRWLCEQLAAVYRRWGYAEVAPPHVERLETLEAGGGIRDRELVRLASDEPLGLRPEMTASIARAACTRLASRPRPLRLWSTGPVFRSSINDVGQPRLEERLQSGVELLGADASQALVADAELLRLLLACLRQLQITAEHQPTLLIGHHAVLSALLDQVPAEQRLATRQALVSFDPLALAELQLPAHQRQGLQQLLRLRGDTKAVLYQLEQLLGPSDLLEQLAGTLNSVAATAAAQGVRLQLDPSFQPHFDLYDGLVLKLVCQGPVAPLALASGGRYDALVARFGGVAGGMGFGFDVEAIRDLLGTEATAPQRPAATLVAYVEASQWSAALDQLEALHHKGEPAELLQSPCATREAAEAIAAERGCAACLWVAS
ncbi:MAG: ATP phosphoribosyltransferase regulatory subunit [Cyanobacteria bacterium M_surface_7_m2_037]|nr:ATP phosphoribosyltransferase regulatory subunit [Cyanobacteria bacterium K_DeepCast_0m_m1_088]MBM5794807.1 ATP phosphoribosyltransferase regulatory subunit [Cyanobacteria bacterium M_surface_7_m2_037]MBM5818509.1 ATP phosphoribosyltransferase regulatory subunit [Cyanobacteria bacterium K_DeepCast_150m_m2_101]